MRLANVDQFINEISIDLGFDVPKLKPVIKRWAYQAVSKMGIAYLNIKKKEYTNLTVPLEKPDDFVKADHIFFVQSDGGCVEPYYNDNICCGSTDIWNMIDNGYYAIGEFRGTRWSVDETMTHFTLPSDAKTAFSKVLLIYWAVPIDNEGDPMIPEIAKDAVFAYVKWKYLNRTRGQRMTAAGRNPVALSQLNWWHEKWKNEYFAVIGEINCPGPRQMKEIGEFLLFGVPNDFPPLLTQGWNDRIKF